MCMHMCSGSAERSSWFCACDAAAALCKAGALRTGPKVQHSQPRPTTCNLLSRSHTHIILVRSAPRLHRLLRGELTRSSVFLRLSYVLWVRHERELQHAAWILIFTRINLILLKLLLLANAHVDFKFFFVGVENLFVSGRFYLEEMEAAWYNSVRTRRYEN